MLTIDGSLIKQVIGTKRTIDSSSSLVSLWAKWYKGKTPFHRYYIYNGTEKVRLTKRSLQMAKKVCEDWASLLMNEKVLIGVGSETTNKKIQTLLNEVDFWTKTNRAVEVGFALSYSVIAISIKDLVFDEESGDITDKSKASIGYNVFSAKKVVPITYEDGVLTECAIVSEGTQETTFEIHHKDKSGNYVISVAKYDSVSKALKGEIINFNTLSPMPWFQTIQPNLVNNIDLDSPAPISIFGNSLDTLQAIDNAYDSYDNEFVNGRKRIFVSSKLFKVDKKTGEMKATFDPHDTIFYQLPETVLNNGQTAELVKSVSDTLRTNDHSQKIQDELNYLSSKVGLGVDYYRFEKGRVMTATQVISEKSDTFRNMKRHEILIEKALRNILKAFIYAVDTFTDNSLDFNSEKDQITIQFDDSIIEDKATEKENDNKDVANKILSPVDYRMKWYAEDEKTAKEYLNAHFGDFDIINKATAYEPLLTAGVMPAKMFVKLVYTEEFVKSLGYKSLDELANEIEENIKKSGSITPEDVMALGGYNKGLNE